MSTKLPYDHYDELNVHYIGETFVEDPEHGDPTDAGLFEIEEVNKDVNQMVKSALDHGGTDDLRAALREAERMRRLIKAAPEMFKALERLVSHEAFVGHALPGSSVGSAGAHRKEHKMMREFAEEALPDLDVDLDEVFPFIGERDPPPKKEDVL